MAKKKTSPAKSKPERHDPYLEGAEAALSDRSDTENPYEPATDDNLSWNDGYNSIAEADEPEDEDKE